MRFDLSEGRKFSLQDCHGRFQQIENFDTKQAGMTIYIYINIYIYIYQETRIITEGTYSKSGVFEG